MPAPVSQAAAIPLQRGQVCLVTSRSGRRWVIPKGKIENGHTPGEAALTEAWEEAGLLGTLQPTPVGTYVYEKYGLAHNVTVFVMNVAEVRADWPERRERRREWMTVDVAIERIEEPELRGMLRGFLQQANGI